MCLKCKPPTLDELRRRGYAAALRGHFDSRSAYKAHYAMAYGKGYDSGLEARKRMEEQDGQPIEPEPARQSGAAGR